MEWIVFWIVCIIASAIIAGQRGASVGLAIFLTFLLGPIGVVVSFALRKKAEGRSEDTKKCPFCAEIIKSDAIICRHCQKELPRSEPMPSDTAQTETKPCPHCKATIPTASDFCMQCYKSV